MLASMFQRLFTLRRSIFDAKKIIRQENVDLHSVFDELDRRNKGVIEKKDVSVSHFELPCQTIVLTLDQIEAFLKSISREFEGDLSELEVLAYRMDIDKDGAINFKDFYMFFTL